jgi:chemotaxis protein histidine kinase CheA
MTQSSDSSFQSLSDELKTEFYTSFKEAMDELDNCFTTLNCRYDTETINEMFRAVHSVKGNCHMVFLDPIADVCHKLEDIVHQIRKGDYLYTPAQGEFMTFVFARLEQLIAAVISGGSLSVKGTQVLLEGVAQVYEAPMNSRDSVIQKTLDSFSGILSSSDDLSDKVLERLEKQALRGSFDELEFMREISLLTQAKSIQLQGNRDKLLELCLTVNQHMALPVDEGQLSAAFHFQILGARFISSPVFDVTPNSQRWEREKAQQQLELSAGFLRLGDRWLEAAEMIQQSFERYDGQGLMGLGKAQINSGAMILSLIRFYRQSFYKLSKDNRTKIAVSKSLSRINSEKGYRFSPQVVEVFNQLVRNDLLAVSF